MKALGLKGTIGSVLSANGPAQMLTYSFWGALIAGMFYDYCDMCIPNELIIFWGLLSAAITPVVVWFSKTYLKNLLLLDFVVSAVIFMMFITHEPHSTAPVYYSMSANGMTAAARPSMEGHSVSDWFHASALIWMCLHALYLANLTQRQILERRRFSQ
jgi:predicted membrane-bound mannosyltransferase